MAVYIYQRIDWPRFTWNHERLSKRSTKVSHHQGRLLGRMEALDPRLQAEAILRMLTLEVIHACELEDDTTGYNEVQTAVARHFGIVIDDPVPVREGTRQMVEMMLDATQRYAAPLTEARLNNWHRALFPKKGGSWRENLVIQPLQIVARQTVRYQAPHSYTLKQEMKTFLDWFATTENLDPLLAAGIAHIWFLTVQPYEDGNGRIARTITALQLARADDSPQRFYSMSAQLAEERVAYHDMLEKTQSGTLDITEWLDWFLQCLDRSLTETENVLNDILERAKFWERTAGMSLNDRQKKMLLHLLEEPGGKVTSSYWAELTSSSSDTAVRDINDLLQKGILIKKPAGGRSTSYTLLA